MITKVLFCKTLKSLRSATRYFVTAIHYIRFKLSEQLCLITGKQLPMGWRSTMPPSSGQAVLEEELLQVSILCLVTIP